MNTIDHLTVAHGDIVEPRHLWLASSNNWPDESDTDQHYAEPLRVPLRVPLRQQIDIWSALTLFGAGAIIATIVWFAVGGS